MLPVHFTGPQTYETCGSCQHAVLAWVSYLEKLRKEAVEQVEGASMHLEPAPQQMWQAQQKGTQLPQLQQRQNGDNWLFAFAHMQVLKRSAAPSPLV